MKKILPILLLMFFTRHLMAVSDIPETVLFCNIELHLDADARANISETVNKIKRYPASFQTLVDRANTYFPIVEEAFDLRGVPQDLKYIIIQESAFIADAVSSSNAVGYWQFKAESAKEAGIVIDEFVDERKHIFYSSLGAAKYFYNNTRLFDNYLYAVIGYNRGPVGALPFTEESNFGMRKMNITGQTHWYALKAIAHKLAYEDAIGKADPSVWLQPMRTEGETDVKKLAAAQNVSLEEFKKYNLWINGDQLPIGRAFIYYIPKKSKPDLNVLRHINGGDTKMIGGNLPPKLDPIPQPAEIEKRDNRKFAYLESKDDAEYGLEYVKAKAGENLVEIAVRYGVKTKRIKEYNGFTNASRLKEGDIVYLKSPKSRRYHIVQQGETMHNVALLYATTDEKLREKNRIQGNAIYAGQKLSLRKKTMKGAKPTLLASEPVNADVVVKEEKIDAVKPKPETKLLSEEATSYRLPTFESKMVTHTVIQGESVWKVAKKYGGNAEVIKKLNGLTSNELKVGSEIKVLQVMDLK